MYFSHISDKIKRVLFVNISSIGGQMTFALGSLYHGTKFAVEGISESLHYEMKEIGVKVKIIEPGFIETDLGAVLLTFRREKFQNTEPLLRH